MGPVCTPTGTECAPLFVHSCPAAAPTILQGNRFKRTGAPGVKQPLPAPIAERRGRKRFRTSAAHGAGELP